MVPFRYILLVRHGPAARAASIDKMDMQSERGLQLNEGNEKDKSAEINGEKMVVEAVMRFSDVLAEQNEYLDKVRLEK